MRLQMGQKNLDKTRWIALIASLVIMSTTAIGFVWSLYVAPMCELRGATAESMAAVYSGLALTGALLTIIGGKLVDKFGASKVILSAIIAFAIGHIITGMTTNFWGFALPKLTLISWQQSVVYIAIYTNVVKMFPDWKGLATAVAGTGTTVGGVYLPVLVQGMIDSIGFNNMFYAVAGILTLISLIGLFFFPDASDDYVPAGYKREETAPQLDGAAENTKSGFVQKDWKMMLKDPAFYLVFLAPIMGLTTFMLLSYQLAWIAQDILGITAMQSAFLVSALSIIGMVSSILGPVSDKLGRLPVAIFSYLFGTIGVVGLIFANSHGFVWFVVFAFLYRFCFGGFATYHPVIVCDLFGSKNFGFNWSICYQAVLISSAISPWLGVLGRTDDGNYTLTFTIAAIMCAIGLVMMIALWVMRKDKLEPQVKKVKDKGLKDLIRERKEGNDAKNA